MYLKDFDNWNIKKKEINASSSELFFNEREIWWCSLGINIDVEMDGKNCFYERPVLILKKINYRSAWILPLTSTRKDSIYLYPLKTMDSSVAISQIRNISNKRLIRKEARISIEEYVHIIIRLKYLLTFPNETSPNHNG